MPLISYPYTFLLYFFYFFSPSFYLLSPSFYFFSLPPLISFLPPSSINFVLILGKVLVVIRKKMYFCLVESVS